MYYVYAEDWHFLRGDFFLFWKQKLRKRKKLETTLVYPEKSHPILKFLSWAGYYVLGGLDEKNPQPIETSHFA